MLMWLHLPDIRIISFVMYLWHNRTQGHNIHYFLVSLVMCAHTQTRALHAPHLRIPSCTAVPIIKRNSPRCPLHGSFENGFGDMFEAPWRNHPALHYKIQIRHEELFNCSTGCLVYFTPTKNVHTLFFHWICKMLHNTGDSPFLWIFICTEDRKEMISVT